jgi:hypothetical protein
LGDHGGKIRRERGFERQALIGPGRMIERYRRRMKHHAGRRDRLSNSAVPLVAHDRVTDRRHVDPDLMGAPRLELTFDKCDR